MDARRDNDISVGEDRTNPPLLLSDFAYDLPNARIAQTPIEPRDHSRLLVVRKGGTNGFEHRRFYELPNFLRAGDLLVVNETRVSAVRLFGTRAGGGAVEALLVRPMGDANAQTWEALVRPGARIREGDMLTFADAGLVAAVVARTDEGGRLLRLTPMGGLHESVDELLEAHGRVPLPPYITTPLEIGNSSRYQTVYATTPGSAAAPTAGLHFTPELLATVATMGVETARVRLDVGLGTFRPIKTDDVSQHVMHAEAFEVDQDVVEAIGRCRSRGSRVIAVGTTSVRALETAALRARELRIGEDVVAMRGETQLFVQPGFRFGVVDGMVTNFHQPRSTLLLLVAAFAGQETMRCAYETALANDYRFLSFGDAMLII